MNITHVVENLNRGGLERMVLELVKQQQAQGYCCQVVCVFDSGTLAHELGEHGIPVIIGDKRRGLDLRALSRVRHAVRAHRTEVLHTHNAVAHYLAVLATRGLGIHRIINTRHGMGANRRSGRREWLFQRAMRATDTVALVCEAARRAAIERGIVPTGKAVVVPNGIRVERFDTASVAAREHLRRMLELPAATQIVGTVGRLNWTKDQASLIRAFRQVRDRQPATALVLVGGGELRAELEQCAITEGVANAVHFLGDRSDVRTLLQGLDVFALSSLSEGYSMALLEACAVRLPIVATDVGGNGEIVRDGLTGVLVPPSDPTRLAEAIIALLQQPARAQAVADAAHAWVRTDGSLETMAARYADLYDTPTP